MRQAVFMILIIAVSLVPVYATATISTDKSSYQSGDSIVLAGSIVPVEDEQFISVQILNPSKSDFVQIDTFTPNSDGTFSRTYKAEGPKWNTDGTYTLKLFYNQDNFQTTFEFETNPPPPTKEPEHTEKEKHAASKQEQESKPIPPKKKQDHSPEQKPKISSQPKPSEKEIPPTIVSKQEPKTHISGFPALDKSPQYYFERYGDEEKYRDWFDSQFPGKSIQDVVGYTSTHVPGFPHESKSPKYYIDRYNNEPAYRDWFDSQFPDKSPYDIMGFPEPVPIPEWIKNNAQWWATGKIEDKEFILGLQFMIENNIIVIEDLPEPNSNAETVPDWIRNNASWWAQEKISEEEFVNGVKYLITNGIFAVN